MILFTFTLLEIFCALQMREVLNLNGGGVVALHYIVNGFCTKCFLS